MQQQKFAKVIRCAKKKPLNSFHGLPSDPEKTVKSENNSYPDTVGVVGSNPIVPTKQIEGL